MADLFPSPARPTRAAAPAPLPAQVVPLTPVEGAYTYAVPPHLDAAAAVGARVLVPFGARPITGVITAREPAPAAMQGKRLKAIAEVLDDAPPLLADLLKLTRWMAAYYACSWGEVLKAALPAGVDAGGTRLLARTDAPAAWRGAPLGRDLLVWLDAQPDARAGLDVTTLGARFGRTVPGALLAELETAGLVQLSYAATRAVQVKTERTVRLLVPADRAQEAVRGARQLAAVAAIAELGQDGADALGAAQSDVLQQSGASSATIKRLAELGLVEIGEREVVRSPLDAAPAVPTAPPAFHPSQRGAVDAIATALMDEKAETFLLQGVTGSGKTEVYLQALAATRALGKTAIVLVPEIALTPQTVRRFRGRFGDEVAVLHSRMSAGERYDAWRLLRQGRYRIAIGPRSAVLAPLENVGLIVVDEEHETSYKQFDPAPRYHARDVAVVRAHFAGAVCVLGSATPSFESAHNARTGKYTLLTMPQRVPVKGHAAAPLPAVRAVDLAREKEVRRLRGALAHPLREAIARRLERGEQTILLQNRRGYAPVLSCDSCGTAPTCPDCAVSLTLHRPGRGRPTLLRCHYCGHAEGVPTVCPACEAPDLAQLGHGTQRIEEELAELFPQARVLRMDLDTTGTKDAHARLLAQFGRGEADILVGTQMVAKGLDFPRVTLVGVVDADTGMLLPDFRASERAFQLIAQVAGRAGRADLPGEVLVQTRNPEHPAVQFALRHDVDGFAEHELAERRMLGYPPYGRLLGVEFKGPTEEAAERLAQAWTAEARALLALQAGGDSLSRLGGSGPPAIDILGPTQALIGKIKGHWRFHTILKATLSTPHTALQHLARTATHRIGTLPKGCRVNLDVDPVGLY